MSIINSVTGVVQDAILNAMYDAGGGVVGTTLTWEALVPDSDDDYDMLLEDTGAGSASVARTDSTTTGLMLDSEGVYRDVPTDTAVWQDGREANNLCHYTNELGNATYWTPYSGLTDESYTTDPDGGNEAWVGTYSGGGFHKLLDTSTPNQDDYEAGMVVGDTYTHSIWLKVASGTATLKMRVSTLVTTTITVTTTWQRFSTTAAATHTTNTNPFLLTNGDNATFYMYAPQFEHKASASVTAPSEYVRNPTASIAYKYFGNANGNTVASNVVTEATGSALSPTPALHIDPPLTNILLYSRDLSNAAWTGTATSVYNATGLTGIASTASTVTETNGTGAAAEKQTLTVIDDTATYTVRWFVKQDATPTAYPAVNIKFTGGTTEIEYRNIVDVVNGAMKTCDSLPFAKTPIINDIGDWLEITGEITNNGTGNTSLTVQFFPAISETYSDTNDAAAQGSNIIGNIEIYKGVTLEQVKGTAPIFTTTAAVTSDNQITTFSGSNLDETSDFGISFELEGNDQSGTVEPNPIISTQDTDTILLVHSDTFDGDTDIVDSSYIEKAISVGGTQTHHETDQSKFGATSIHFDGSDYFEITDTPSNYELGLNGESFNISCWLRVPNVDTSVSSILGVSGDTGNWNQTDGVSWWAYLDPANSGEIRFGYNNGGGSTTVQTVYPFGASNNTWFHLAIINDATANTFKIYVDGVDKTSTPTSAITIADVTSPLRLRVGASPFAPVSSYLDANTYLDELRILKGVAGDATVPTSPHDRGSLAQVEIAYVDETGNLVIEDQGGAKATAPLSSGVNKCGIFKESGNIGVTVSGTTGTLVASSNNVGGNGNIQIGHGVTSPIEIKNIKGYTGGSLQTQMETDTA